MVIASQIDTATYGPYFQGLPALFEEVESGSLYEQYVRADSQLKRYRFGLTWRKYQGFLKKILRYYQTCTVVSAHEKHVISRFVDKSSIIEIIPNCVDIDFYEGISADRHDNVLIFTGSFTYQPNYEAMLWFTRDVFPRILAQAPGTKLLVTGNHGNRPLLSMDRVVLTGFVADIRSLVASAGCSVIPILSGGGTRLKILEAMALNTPVVSTPKGAEGLDFCHGEHLLLADNANGFAEAVLTLMNDQTLRKYLSTNARQRLVERYNWSVEIPHFLTIVEKIGSVQL
jgi:glycosyltransferase involved in cell wall biosynthesis